MEEKLRKQCYARVPTREDAEVVLRYYPDQAPGVLEIERTDKIIGVHAQPVIRAPLSKRELKRMPFILDGIALFRYHLLRSHEVQKVIQDVKSSVITDGVEQVEMQLYRLTEQGVGYRNSMGENLLKGNHAHIKSSDDKRYGIKITNRTHHSFYPYLFYFDPSDYSIKLLSSPYTGQMNAPLHALQFNEPGQVTVGYGQGGGDPIQFTCDDVPDTGFLKLFVSDVYVDMEHIAQGPAMEAKRKRKAGRKADDHKIWGSSVAVLTVTPPHPE